LIITTVVLSGINELVPVITYSGTLVSTQERRVKEQKTVKTRLRILYITFRLLLKDIIYKEKDMGWELVWIIGVMLKEKSLTRALAQRPLWETLRGRRIAGTPYHMILYLCIFIELRRSDLLVEFVTKM
jgi:hypothetical protein